MNVHVEKDRFLSVACEPGERIVFDRKEIRYHLLRDTAARLWDEIGEGGTFELTPAEAGVEDPVSLLIDAGLLETTVAAGEGVTRRVWLSRTGKASAAALVLPLVATISAPQLALGQGPSLDERTPDPDQTNIEQTKTEETTQTSFTETNPGPTGSPQILDPSPGTLERQRRRQEHYEEKQSQPPRKKNQSKGRGRGRDH